MAKERLAQQIAFLAEVDKLKQVLRQTVLLDASRQENAAEHTWHLCLLALVLAEYANGPVDMLRVLKLLLVHDLVEIDAGDTFAYDEQGYLDKAEREERGAARLFGLLPADQGAELRALWAEFEAAQTPEAQFANALDRFQPLLHNHRTGGLTWRRHGVTSDRVLARNAAMAAGSARLWEYARALIADAVARGFLPPGAGED